MSALSVCEYIVIRVAPDPIRNESVAIGVALFEPRAGGFSGVRVAPDLRRARQLSPTFEPADLDGLARDLEARLGTMTPEWRSREYLLRLAAEGFSHTLQFSTPTAVLTGDPAAELERLYRAYAAPPEAAAATVAAGARRRILLHLQRVFREERIPRLAPAAAREWLGGGDRFRFDFHYRGRRDATVHLIQAVDLGAEDESGIKDLCYTFGRLRRREAAGAPRFDLAAFVESADAASLDEPALYRRHLLDEAGARVLALAQAPEECARIRGALA